MSVDIQYMALVQDILTFGKRGTTRTGKEALKVFGQSFRFDLQDEFPIVSIKKTFFESLKKELFWIYVDQSNDVDLLKEKYGVKIWDEWKRADGTIGDAYGEQVRKHGQIDRLIHGLRTDPQGRRHIISLWSWEDLDNMALAPCAFQTIWDVSPDGNLNMQLVQRSGDVGLGVPFNIAQYALLQHMVAHVVGLEVGEFWHTITNAHIYADHIEPLKQIFDRPLIIHKPQIEIVREVKDWYDFKPEDIVLHGYESHPHIKMEVAI